MSAVAETATRLAEAAASPRPARRRPVPPSLPRGLGRLAALAVATPVTVMAAQVVGAAALPLVRTLPLVLASALLLVLVALGVRLRGILVTAALAVAAAIPLAIVFYAVPGSPGVTVFSTAWFLISLGGTVVAPGQVATFVLLLPVAACVLFVVVVRSIVGGSSPGLGLALGATATFAATAWPLLAILGFGSVAAVEPVALLWAAGTAPLAWLAAAAGRTAALRPGVVLAAMRDACFRVLALAAALASAAWLGQAVEIHAGRAASGTPLESLAATAGWATAALMLAAVGWIAWRVPRWLVVGQLRGRFEAVAVSETLVAATLCCLVPLVLWRLDAGVVLGREWLVALAAAASYGWVRLWFAAPASVPNVPLWILVTNGVKAQTGSVGAKAARAWHSGQVTVLAVPEDAQRIGGEHLRAAGLAGEMEALFPLRPVHLDDWADAQPDAWAALPVREVYAPGELWAQVLATRVETSAQALVILARGPGDPRRRVPGSPYFPFGPVLAAILSRSSALTVRPEMTEAELARLGTVTLSPESELQEELRSMQAPASPPLRRFVVMFGSSESLPAAERVARLMHAQLDARGWTVECHVVLRGAAAWLRRPRVQLGSWRLSALLLARGLAASGRSVPARLAAWLPARLLGHDDSLHLDVVEWEGADVPASRATPPARVPAVDLFVAVRGPGGGVPDASSVPSIDAGEIRIGRGDSTEATAEVVARKLLGYELTPLRPRAESAPPEAEPGAQRSATPEANAPPVADTSRVAEQAVAGAERPVLFVSCDLTEASAYVYRALVRGLQDRLPDMEVIGSDFIDVQDTVRRARVQSILARAVATLVVVSRDGVREGYASEEITIALEGGGRVIPVLLDGARMPSEEELPPAIRSLARWNALEFDALRGDPEALTRLVGRVAEVLGAGGEAPAPVRDRARLRIYLCSHPGDRPRHTYRLRQDLADRFGPDSTHTDLVALLLLDSASGRPTLPEGALAHADAIVLVMGPEFATLLREIPQKPGALDPLRRTLRAALTMGRRLVPVLVDGATMPHGGDLPGELRDLPRRQAVPVRDDSWTEDVTRLGDIIEEAVGRRRGENDPA